MGKTPETASLTIARSSSGVVTMMFGIILKFMVTLRFELNLNVK
ncbi:hypothetical protein NC99_12090 [Sunxiuqinia dokdonensis]|uniref:Uncharacterized protein n=1 Tax=Sunxiuqinia dokdonensis TaxID=1409788 RepID=A0A0L8VBY3_9BACT|nr:hypothetical protein NC99_12090 [Sunxiuqinia dokdonensis]